MAWPGQFNPFWDPMNNDRPHPQDPGAGVDHAPSPPPPFTNPDLWNRWLQGRGWDGFIGGFPGQLRGPPGRPGRAHGSGTGRGDRREPGGPDATPPVEFGDGEEIPPEYITDEEIAAATAAAKGELKKRAGDRDSPDTMMQDNEGPVAGDDPPEEAPTDEDGGDRCCGRRGRRGGRGGCGSFGRGGEQPRRFCRHGGFPSSHHHGPIPPPLPFFSLFGGGPGPRGPLNHHAPHASHDHPRGPPPGGYPGVFPFDLRSLMRTLANYPYAEQVREYIERAQGGHQTNDSRTGSYSGGGGGDAVSFTPPLDIFEQAGGWVLHLAVPGAKKEDVGVDWDPDRGVLRVSGVVHRPGDEEFLRGLVRGERRVGLFSREVELPPRQGGDTGGAQGPRSDASREDVNAEGIAARMQDGVLIITVPKAEKGWTEVKRVQIE